MLRLRKSKQKGFSLVELGIVLAVVGVALFFTISTISQTKVTTSAQNARRDLTQIITNAQRLYSTKGAFPVGTWNNNAVLIRNNVFPASWVAGPDAIISPFGGAVRFDTVSPTVAAIVLNDVPSKVCAELGEAMMDSVLGILTGAPSTVSGYYAKNPATGEINLDNLGLGCTSASYVPMAFSFGRN
jgi:prepilin-type N-terminal cleavage/methylation domain-containing protein